MNEPFDDADKTPRPIELPLHSPLSLVQDRLDERIDRLGARLGSKIEEHTETFASQRVWNSEIGGADAKNGKVGRTAKVIDRVIAAVLASAVTAGAALYLAGFDKATDQAKMRAAEAWIEKAEDRIRALEVQVLLRTYLLPPAVPVQPLRSDP